MCYKTYLWEQRTTDSASIREDTSPTMKSSAMNVDFMVKFPTENSLLNIMQTKDNHLVRSISSKLLFFTLTNTS